jgi:predicted nucleic acid-binding protein
VYVVDASVWVSWFVPADAHHDPSRRWMSAQVAQGEPIVAPLLVLAEVAGAVARRTGLSALGAHAVSLVRHLPNARLVAVDEELAQLGALVAAQLRLRGADALYVALARRLGIPLVTWDQEQRERGRPLIAVLNPQDILTL